MIEQNRLIKNISGTVCVMGMVLSGISANSTIVGNGNYNNQNAIYSFYNENSPSMLECKGNIYYEQSKQTRLEEDAEALFGIMRDATDEEQASVNAYIKSISKDTGVNFFDIC